MARRENLVKYYDGNPCARGHTCGRYVKSNACTECAKLSVKNSPSSTLYHARERMKKWRPQNRERSRDNDRAARLRNIEKAKLKDKKRYWKNPEKYREQSRLRKILNPEKAKIHYRLKMRRRRASPGSFTKDDVDRIFRLQKYKCAYCRISIKNNYHIDHIVPLSKGGTHYPSNLQGLCPHCNMTKQARDPIDFAQALGFLV